MKVHRLLCTIAVLSALTVAFGCSGSRHEQEVRVTAERFVAAWKAGDEGGVGDMLGGAWLDPSSPAGIRSLEPAEVQKVAKVLVSGQKPVADSIVGVKRTLADPANGVAEVCLRLSSIGPTDELLCEWSETRLLFLVRSREGWKVDFLNSRVLWDPFSSGQIIAPGIKPENWADRNGRK
jgi:hypothetical protein